jgi:hypothetical protein
MRTMQRLPQAEASASATMMLPRTTMSLEDGGSRSGEGQKRSQLLDHVTADVPSWKSQSNHKLATRMTKLRFRSKV